MKVAKFCPLMSSFLEICKMGICWVDDFKGGHFNMFIMRVAQLNKQGLCIMGDLWNPKIKAFCF